MCLPFADFCLASPKDVQTDFLLPRLQEHLNMEREERVRSELVCCAVGLLPSARVEDCLPLVRPILAFLNHNLDQVGCCSMSNHPFSDYSIQ